MTTLQLLKSATVALDASGAGSVVLGPERGGERWSVTRMAVQNTSALRTDCAIYRDIISSQTMLFGSSAGNSDVASGDPPLELQPANRLIVVWSGGTPGAIGTVVLEGKLTR